MENDKLKDALATTATCGMILEELLRYYQTDSYKSDDLTASDMIVDIRKIAELLL